MAVYTTIDNPELYFQVKLYTGSGSIQAITLDGDENMQPDFVWCKSRSENRHHYLADSIRGVKSRIRTDANNGVYTADATNGFDSFDSDGFTLEEDDSSLGLNESSHTMVAYCWKAGTAFSNDASATSVGSIDSAGTINTTAGISIIEYSGTGSQGTIAHGLQAKPGMLWFKRLDTTGNWVNYHKSIGATKYLRFDTTAVEITASDEFNDTEPTTSVFTVDTDGAINASGTDNHIVYCFAEKQGFSKVGSFEGNSSTDGPFIYTGFTPSMILYKNADYLENWHIQSWKQESLNPNNNQLTPNETYAESSDSNTNVDFLSNGFKMRSSHRTSNYTGNTFVYIAFADAPFVNSNGVPCNAR